LVINNLKDKKNKIKNFFISKNILIIN